MPYKNPETHREYQRLWRKNNPDRYQKQQQQWHEDHPDYYQQWYKNNPDYATVHNFELRLTVLQHYSKSDIPSCNCCGENTLEFLCLDHINNDGNRQRMIHGIGTRMYLWIIKNEYPTDFQVLCHNCNMAKGLYGQCPHKLGSKLEYRADGKQPCM